ncbi:MAG: alkaline phosphatase D family protein [Solirubrobacteraceae bacterium]
MSSRFTRRRAVAQGVGFALAGTLAPTAVARQARRRPLLREGAFAQGVASGLPSRRRASVWTRVDGLGPREGGLVRVEVARDAAFRDVVERRTALADPRRDHCVRVQVGDVLGPGEEYFYRFWTARAESPVGRLRIPRPADSAEPVRIGFFSCQRYVEGTFAAHAGLAAEDDLDLVVCLGDYIYERNGAGQVAGRDDATSAAEDGQVATLDEYRRKYQLYRSDPQLQAMHAAHPFLAGWDDHEVASNYEGAAGPSPARVPFKTRRRNGYVAFLEHMPFLPERSDRFRTYRALPLGRRAELIVLDTRQYRDRAAGTMLGEAQRKWLFARLAASTATWKIIANQTMCMANDIAPGRSGDLDGWDGFADERRLMFEEVRARGVRNVAFATGDEHEFYAGTLSPSGRTDTPAVATEVVTGAISSGAKPPGSERQQSALGATAQKLANPQWALADGEHNGYGVFEARPDELTVTLRGPREVQDAASPTATIASLRVASGVPGVEIS